MAYIWKLTHLNYGDEFLKVTDDAAEIMDKESDIGIQNRFNLTILTWEGEIPNDERVWLELFEQSFTEKYKEETHTL